MQRKPYFIIPGYLFLLLLICSLGSVNGQTASFPVINNIEGDKPGWMEYTDNNCALYQCISQQAKGLLKERQEHVSSLKKKADWHTYISNMRQRLFQYLNQFDKTPLNPKITGMVRKSDFTIEKIIFESHPGFYVTGCLFIPKKRQDPAPCIIYCSGHSAVGFRSKVYQNVILNLVGKGFIVYAFDPIGQGERVQYYDEVKGQSLIGNTCGEHSYVGAQNLLLGKSLSDYFIWDGVRAIDYLLTRKEVDPKRIGITGRSGGGTQTAMIAAYDERIYASAPECYITNYRSLFETKGPQDAEQNFYYGISKGFDHADFFHLRTPKPSLIVCTTNDFFSIQGAREAFREAKKSYSIFGKPENVNMVESLGGHESTLPNRQAVYGFFQKHLGIEGDNSELIVEELTEDELQVTPTGQVGTSYISKTVFDLIKGYASEIVKERQVDTPQKLSHNKNFILSKIKEVSGLKPSRVIERVVYAGKIKKDKYIIEKYFIQGADFSYPIPFVLIKPDTKEKRPLLLYLYPSGKESLVNKEDEIINCLEKGYTILAPDLIGIGELKNTLFKGDSYIQGYSYNLLFGANLAGTSIAGMQASDLDVIFNYAMERDDIDKENLVSIISGEVCPSYLHYAVFNKNIKKTILANPLISYESIAKTKFYSPPYMFSSVPEAIKYYDLHYLASLLAPTELTIINPVNAKGEVVDSDDVNKELTFLKEYYKLGNKEKNCRIIISKAGKNGLIKFSGFL